MRYRERLCLYAMKHGVTKAARRYHTNRQFVYRQLQKYDGTVRSLALQSRRPHGHKYQHTSDELLLIRRMYRRNGKYGLAEPWDTTEVLAVCVAKYVNKVFGRNR